MAREKLPWDETWQSLESEGWRIEQGPRGKSWQTYYMPPGVKRGPGFKNRIHYFDSRACVLRHLSEVGGAPASAVHGIPVDAKKSEASVDLTSQEVTEDAVHSGPECLSLDSSAPGSCGGPNPHPQRVVPSALVDLEEVVPLRSTEDFPSAAVAAPLAMSALSARVVESRPPRGVEQERALILDASADHPQEIQLAAKVATLRALLEICTAATPETEVLTTLRRLEALGPLSVQVLRSTHVGKTVNSLMKRTQSSAVRMLARSLLTAWKGSVSRSSPDVPKASDAPAGVDAQIWLQIPAECRAWAVTTEGFLPPSPSRSRSKHEEQDVQAKRPKLRSQQSHPSDKEPVRSLKDALSDRRQQLTQRLQPAGRDAELHGNCVVCLCHSKSHAFVPCGHECVCAQCSAALVASGVGKCPVCRTEVTMAMKIYR